MATLQQVAFFSLIIQGITLLRVIHFHVSLSGGSTEKR